MLTKVYKYGPTRQRIMKSFIINGDNPDLAYEVIENISESIDFKIQRNPQRKREIWFDSGMIWLHTVKARESFFQRLGGAIIDVSRKLKEVQHSLLPCGVRPTKEVRWFDYLGSDLHHFEVLDDIEKEVFANLLRELAPIFIALTGRAGIEKTKVESIGSRRLLNSQSDFAPRYFTSLNEKHLPRVIQCLERDEGVTRLDLLDINPLAENKNQSLPSVEIRFTDGQALLSSVRTQAILYQATLIQARRLVANGRRWGDQGQNLIKRNRGRSIAFSFDSVLEIEQKITDKKGKSNFKLAKMPVTSVLLKFLEETIKEMQILEVEYDEIKSAILGPSLYQMGLSGIKNENEMFKILANQPEWKSGNWLSFVSNICCFSNNDDLLSQINEDRFQPQARIIKNWWTYRLRDIPRINFSQNRKVKNKRENELKGSISHAANLLLASIKNDKKIDEIKLISSLNIFWNETKYYDLNKILFSFEKKDGMYIRNLLKPKKRESIFVLRNLEPTWENKVLQNAEMSVKEGLNITIVSLEGISGQRGLDRRMFTKFILDKPGGIIVFLLSISAENKNQKKRNDIVVDLLLVPEFKYS